MITTQAICRKQNGALRLTRADHDDKRTATSRLRVAIAFPGRD
jgi:hypothetical protein